MGLGGFLFNQSGISGQFRDADRKTDEFIRQLKDKKEDLDYLQDQIGRLKQGLKEMPDNSQDGYFTNLLKDFQGKEYILRKQINQLDQSNQKGLQSPHPEDDVQISPLIEQNRENIQDQTQRMNDLLESNQLSIQYQMQMINDLMEQGQMNLDALMERTNDLMDLNQINLQNYALRN